MEAWKRDFYEKAARRYEASTKLYNVDAVVHIENKNDIWFWQQILSKFRPGRYKFMPATVNENNRLTSGCEQCLKYKEFLSQRFFICIDSDLRYLSGEKLYAKDGILQTYTYSWENHCSFAVNLQQKFDMIQGKKPFDFCIFLQEYSKIVYKPFLVMLFRERQHLDGFKREDFNKCISVQYQQGDEQDNGVPFLNRIKDRLISAMDKITDDGGFDFEAESERYAVAGLQETNAYLYVRGHCVYNCLVSIGKKLCEDTGIFEYTILKSNLAFDRYGEIIKIKSDVKKLEGLRKSLPLL